jgi:hypothetical protein
LKWGAGPQPRRVASRFAHWPNIGPWAVFKHIGWRNKNGRLEFLNDLLKKSENKIQ